MPIHVSWQNETQTVVSYRFVGHWNMKQFREAWRQGYDLILEKAGARVDFILDMHESILIPPDFVRQFRQLPFDRQQNLGLVTVIGADEHLAILIETICRSLSYELDVAFAEGLPEALNLIDESRRPPMGLTA